MDHIIFYDFYLAMLDAACDMFQYMEEMSVIKSSLNFVSQESN